MNKSWRLTAVFAGVFVALAAVYFLSSPPATTPIDPVAPLVIPIPADRMTKIEVDRRGNRMTFEKTTDSMGEHWRIAGPTSHAADAALVQQMLFGLDRFLKAGALEPGKPETDPKATGLDNPRIVVAFSSAGRRDVLKFGSSSATDSTNVFYQLEGDPKIYRVGVDTFEAFNKPIFQYRAKNLVRFAPHRVNKVELDFKFMRAKEKGKPAVPEYEHSVMERFEEGLERGWYLTKPHRERLDDHKVAGLVAALASLPAAEYQPEGDAKAQGFDEPQARISVYAAGEDKPTTVHFGGTAENGKKRWVRTPGAGEVALYESFRYDELPLQRNFLRVSVIYPFSIELVRKVEVEAKGLGKVVLERREVRKEGEPVAAVKWEVSEPKDLRSESERVEAFVGAVVVQNVTGFLGPQDFKLVGLDPAPVTVAITTKEGKRHACGFNATDAAGYMRKEGVDEIFEVRPDFVRMLKRLELNFINMEMFNIPRSSLRAFSFEARPTAQLQPVFYALKLDQEGKKWVYTDAAHKGQEADPNKVSDILAILNYIRAEALIARDEKTSQDHRLLEQVAPATLKITYDGGIADLYISDNLSDVVNQPKYYARFSDNKTVFQMSGAAVSTLKIDPVLKK